jgi:hypothetical protein
LSDLHAIERAVDLRRFAGKNHPVSLTHIRSIILTALEAIGSLEGPITPEQRHLSLILDQLDAKLSE